MKYLLPLVFLLGCNSVNVKQSKLSSMSYTNLHCKQKVLPLRVDYREENSEVFAKLTAEKAIEEFEVLEVTGLDGLKVSLVNRPTKHDLAVGEEMELTFPVEQQNGLGYVNLNVSGRVNGVAKVQTIVIPVGKLSAEQKAERSKNIRTQKDDAGTVGNGSKSSTEPENTKVHILKVE